MRNKRIGMEGKGRKTDRERDARRSILPGAVMSAFLASAVLFLVLLGVEKNMLRGYEKGVVYTAAKEIPHGQLITEENCTFYLEKKEIDRTFIPESALTDTDQAYGLLAASSIDPGAMLTTSMFRELDKVLAELEKPVVAGFKAEELYQVAGGTLRTGDRIHIYTVDEESGESNLVWKNVFVRQVFDSAGDIIGNEDTITAAQMVNVLLEENSAETFYSLLTAGSLRAVKVVDGEV